MVECRRRLFHQSIQAMVAYSTSAMVFSRSVWNGPGRMHSVLYSR
jgi:hypothetical protein